jgi:hypothetical protein
MLKPSMTTAMRNSFPTKPKHLQLRLSPISQPWAACKCVHTAPKQRQAKNPVSASNEPISFWHWDELSRNRYSITIRRAVSKFGLRRREKEAAAA